MGCAARRLILGVTITGQFSIHWNDIVDAGNLETVTRIVDDGDIGLVDVACEFSERSLQPLVIRIYHYIFRFEVCIAKHLPDRDSVTERMWHFGNAPVVRRSAGPVPARVPFAGPKATTASPQSAAHELHKVPEWGEIRRDVAAPTHYPELWRGRRP